MFNTYDSIENIQQVKKVGMFAYSVSKREIISKNFERLRKNLEVLKKAGKDAKGKLYLTFEGYEDDEREIYMIPEIRDFVKNIWEEYKYLFYFLTSFDNNKAIIFACINDFKAYQNNNTGITGLKIVYDEEVKLQTITAMTEFGITINDVDGARRELFKFI